MRRILRPVLLVILSVWAGTSCSDLGLLPPPDQGPVTIGSLSVSEGSFAAPGQAVRFIIQAQDARGTDSPILQLAIALKDASGNGVWSAQEASPLLNEELSLTLPELPTGRYSLSLRVSGEEGLLHEKKVGFFCLAGEYGIAGISSYPPTIMPNREGRVTAEFQYPQGSDPYVRWTRDGKVLARGRVSEGMTELTWPAPREEGVYTVQVELFPVPPPPGTDFPTVSPITSSARLFVSSRPGGGTDALGPESSYFALFHFNGSLRDEAAGGAQAELSGSARLTDSGPTPGYLLPGGSGAGIRYPRSILPVHEGRLQPCTLTLGLIRSESAAATGENLLSVVMAPEAGGADAAFALRIFRDPGGGIAALLGAPGSQVLLPSGITSLQPGRMSRLDLSLIPGPSSLQGLWFLDGRQTAAHRVSFSPEKLTAQGQTLIGGENNLEVTVTELGVYYRDESQRPAVDPGIYRAAAQGRYGARLILAEGFEGLFAPDSWTFTGEALPSGGLLILQPEASLRLPYFELGAGETVVSLSFGEDLPEDGRVSLFWEEESAPFAVLEPRGVLRDPLKPKEPISIAPLGSRLQLVLTAASLSLPGGEDSAGMSLMPLAPRAGKATWLTVQVEAPPSAPGLSVDSILIYRN